MTTAAVRVVQRSEASAIGRSRRATIPAKTAASARTRLGRAVRLGQSRLVEGAARPAAGAARGAPAAQVATPRRQLLRHARERRQHDDAVTERARRRWLSGETAADALLATVVLLLAVLAVLVR